MTRYTYDARNRRIASTDPLGNTTTTQYDANNNVKLTTDARGYKTRYDYDALNRLTSTYSPANDLGVVAVATTVYDDFGNVSAVEQGTDAVPNERETDYVYDNVHRLMSETAPPDKNGDRQRTYFTFDVAGNLLTKGIGTTTNQNQLVTTYGYDQLNHLLKEQDPDPDSTGPEHARTYYYGYDLNGNETTFELYDLTPGANAAFSYTKYVYDVMNRRTNINQYDLTAISLALPTGNTASPLPTGAQPYAISTNLYTGTGQLQASYQFVQQLSSGTSQYDESYAAFDGLGRAIDNQSLQLKIDSVGNRTVQKLTETQSQYDAASNLILATVVAVGSTDPNRITRYSHDFDGRTTTQTDPAGNTTTTAYDANGNVVTTTESLNNQTTYTYDSLNRQAKDTPPGQATTSTYYDEFGNVLKTVVPGPTATVTTTYAYDKLNHVLTESIASSASGASNPPDQSYLYDWLGNLTSETDRNGNTVSFTYDSYERLTQKSHTQSGSTETISYQYDPDGKMTSATDKINTTVQSQNTYTYATPLRRLATDWFTQNGLSSTEIVYTHDAAGEVTSRYVAIYTTPYSFTDSYAYDAAGHEVADSQDTTLESASFGYDYADQLLVIARTNGSQSGTATRITADIDGRITSIVDSQGSTTGMQLTYGYDANSRVSSEQESGTAAGNTNGYHYDAGSQLTSATHTATGQAQESYSYDSVGNRLVTPSSGAAYDAFNRLQNDGSYKYTYDNNGNLLTQTQIASGAVIHFNYDSFNRLYGVDVKNSSGSTIEQIIYQYDALGNRIQTSVDPDGPSLPQAPVVTNYVYASVGPDADTSQPLFARNSSSQVTHRYLYGPGMTPGAVDQVLADNTLIPGTGGTAGTRWALADQQGSVRQLINTSGTVTSNFNYDSYGNPLTSSGNAKPDAVDFLFGYAGGVYDGALANYNGGSGLEYFVNRYYNPRTGQFTSVDPANADVLNTYRYVGNDPVNATDPYGLYFNNQATRSVYGSSSSYSSSLNSFSAYDPLEDVPSAFTAGFSGFSSSRAPVVSSSASSSLFNSSVFSQISALEGTDWESEIAAQGVSSAARAYASSLTKAAVPFGSETESEPAYGLEADRPIQAQLFGQSFVTPWNPNAAGASDTLVSYARAIGVAASGTATGAASGATTGTVTGAAVGAGIGSLGGGVGAIPGAAAGASAGFVSGLFGGAVSGFISSIFADNAEEAAYAGLTSGGVAGVGSGAFSAATKVVQLGDAAAAFASTMQQVETLDFSTQANKAVFYSGPGQGARAAAYAERTGAMTIEMTPGGCALAADPVFQSLSPAQQYQVWQKASTPFAEGASGQVNAFIKGARDTGTFRTIEEPILNNSANVYKSVYHY